MNTVERIEKFLSSWSEDSENIRTGFADLKNQLVGYGDVNLEFNERKGVSYSLRAAHSNMNERPLFVMVDVIDDNPRWLSVCFYAEMASDPESLGDVVPGGLLGEDGLCFDMDVYSEEIVEYLKKRVEEAYLHAAGRAE